MELTLKRYVKENWEVTNCIQCDEEPELITRVSISDANKHQVFLKYPECKKTAEGGTYIEHYNEGSVNARYQAIIKCITAWENMNRPIKTEDNYSCCEKCSSIDKCISNATNYPNNAIRCPNYGLLKKCVERIKEEC